MLAATRLRFRHPVTNDLLDLDTRVSGHFGNLLRWLDWNVPSATTQ